MELPELCFETVEKIADHAAVIRFRLKNLDVKLGDVLLVLDGTEVRFHGLIQSIDNGWAVAADRRGSTIPVTV